MKIKMYVLSLFFLFIPIIFYFSGIDDVWNVFTKANGFCDGVSNRIVCITGNMGNQLSLSVSRLCVCIFWSFCVAILTGGIRDSFHFWIGGLPLPKWLLLDAKKSQLSICHFCQLT